MKAKNFGISIGCGPLRAYDLAAQLVAAGGAELQMKKFRKTFQQSMKTQTDGFTFEALAIWLSDARVPPNPWLSILGRSSSNHTFGKLSDP